MFYSVLPRKKRRLQGKSSAVPKESYVIKAKFVSFSRH